MAAIEISLQSTLLRLIAMPLRAGRASRLRPSENHNLWKFALIVLVLIKHGCVVLLGATHPSAVCHFINFLSAPRLDCEMELAELPSQLT